MDNKDHSEEIKPVEIKDLNKTQLILLAILLSFITSIATGIVTVTLMQQAPTGVTQTINRVVQQTIEKVVPDYTPGKTQTVVVKEEDLVVDAVSKTRANFISIYESKDAKESLVEAYSVGNGTFFAPSAPLDATKTYIVKAGEKQLEVKVVGVSPLGISVLTLVAPDPLAKTFPVAAFGKDADIKTGQTAVIVTGSSIKKGVVQSVKKATDETLGTIVSLDFSPNAGTIGAVAVNLDGNTVGIVVPKGVSEAVVIGIDAVTKFVAHPSIPVPKPTPIPAPTPTPVPDTTPTTAPTI